MIKAVSWILLLLAFTSAQASDLRRRKPAQTCDLGGKFESIVFKVLSKPRAVVDSSYGLTIVDRKSGDVICSEFVEGDQNIYPASTIKTLVALSLFRKIDAGEVTLHDSVVMNQPNASDECVDSDCNFYGPGKSLTIERLLEDMITVSNNLATNQLIDVVSKDYINETAQMVRATGLHLYRKVYNHVDPEPEITTKNRSNATGYTALYLEIATGKLRILSEASRQLLIGVLSRQKINGSLNKLFPPEVHFYHKTGNTSQVTGDAGFYYFGKNDDKIAILVGLQNFTKIKDCARCAEKTGFQSLAEVGKAALELTLSLP